MKYFLFLLSFLIELFILSAIYLILDISVYNSYFAAFLMIIFLCFIVPFTWKKIMNLYKKKDTQKETPELPENITEFFNKFKQKEESFETLKKTMNIENQEINVDGVSNPNYGLSASNPIFVKGPNGTDLYLLRLSTTNGEKLQWERIGSTRSEGVPGNTDVYKGILQNGVKYIEIYLNWYGNTNSTVAPQGLIINL